MKVFDCITFFEENFLTNLRFNILSEVVDYFVICESSYGHDGIKKELKFNKEDHPKFKNKIIHLVLDNFPDNFTRWQRQNYQRDYLFKGIESADNNDLIIFSDSDEIPNPDSIKNINTNKKFVLFIQKHYCYKFNILNKTEEKWEGSRACKKKFLKDFNWLRTKVRKKNIRYPFWRIDKIKDIDVIENGGWHFSYFLNPEEIKNKIKSAPHEEFINDNNLNIDKIKKKINLMHDPLGRNHKLEKTTSDLTLPKFVSSNKKKFLSWFIS